MRHQNLYIVELTSRVSIWEVTWVAVITVSHLSKTGRAKTKIGNQNEKWTVFSFLFLVF